MSERDAERTAGKTGDERLTTADIAGGREDAARGDTDDLAAEPVDRDRVDGDPVGSSTAAAGATADTEPGGSGGATQDSGATGSGMGATAEGDRQPLFAADETEGFRSRWADVQAGFVDEPRRAVEDADALVAEVMQRLAETFSTERATLEQQWDGDSEPSTEDLRVGLQRYRSFFDRLLSA
ncbi:MAG: hypothetical protein ACR2GT_02085 [Gaiellaceae bacterium]